MSAFCCSSERPLLREDTCPLYRFMNIFVSTWALLVGGLLCAIPLLYARITNHTGIEDGVPCVLQFIQVSLRTNLFIGLTVELTMIMTRNPPEDEFTGFSLIQNRRFTILLSLFIHKILVQQYFQLSVIRKLCKSCHRQSSLHPIPSYARRGRSSQT